MSRVKLFVEYIHEAVFFVVDYIVNYIQNENPCSQALQARLSLTEREDW